MPHRTGRNPENTSTKESYMKTKQNMYANVATWNPQVGCKFNCIYCKPSFQRTVNRVYHCHGARCTGCRDFTPHGHPERLSTPLPSKPIIWPCAHGDISFGDPNYIKKVIDRTNGYPRKEFYWQSKNPSCFKQYLPYFPGNTILLTTLETNRNKGYNEVSRAPLPSARYKAFQGLRWDRKIVTIEPILDFDPDIFLKWLIRLNPEAVWLGYNSKPRAVKLPEPSLEKTLQFVEALEAHGIEVRKKTMR